MTDSATDTFAPFDWLNDELAALEAEHLRRDKRTVIGLPDGRCSVDGRELVNFASNDYLGLAADTRLIAAAQSALIDSGTGARASALVTGHTPWQQRLEQRIARFENTEAALVFPTGYAANMGTIAALVGDGDVVCADRWSHASLIDGCRLSGARFRVYPHNDFERLDRELAKHTSARRRLIVTDGLFSMDGDLAPLPELCNIAERHQAMLLVDEAHGTGVLGAHGRGSVDHFDVEDRPLVRVGTLSKAIGTQGGFVAGSQALIDWLVNRARPQIYSTALNPAACAAAVAAFDIIESEPERRENLLSLGTLLRTRLQENGLTVDCNHVSPIVPLIVGSPTTALRLAAALELEGFLVAAIRPPTVARNSARLRISLSAAHTAADIEALAAHLARLWPS